MNIKKITGALYISVCLMFSMFLPVHAANNVTLAFEKTEIANELQVVITGMPKTKSLSLNVQVEGDVTFDDTMKLSSELQKLGARVDTRQASKNTLDIYVTSKQEIDVQGKIILGSIQLRGDVKQKYKLSLNKAKDGIKGVSSAYEATQIPADSKNLVMEGTVQEIVDSNKPVDPDKPGNDSEKPGEGEKPDGNNEQQGDSDITNKPGGDITITDGNASASGGTQIDKKMKLSVTEVKDTDYLAMVKKSLAKISTKYKAYNIQITKNGKAITLKDSVKIRINIPEGFDKTKLKVYDIQQNNRSELAFTVDGNTIEFSITHLGNYVIAEQNVNEKDISVGTGDSTSQTLYYALAGAAIVSIAILAVLREKRKHRIQN